MRPLRVPCVVLPCLLAACSAAPQPRSAQASERPRARWQSLDVVAVEPARDAVKLQPSCTPGAAERCNALDDDCDAAIDEGCGYLSGPLQVTAHWNGPADVDLHVVDPHGGTLSPQHRAVESGGRLDRFAFGACHESDPPPRLENAFWTKSPPEGRYRVALALKARCEAELPITATLSLRLGEKAVHTFNVQLTEEGQRVPVVSVRLGGSAASASRTP